jgi:U1 small nuclear ribonucleoprotein C
MPKFYCPYCDIYLAHSSAYGRRQHHIGKKHITMKVLTQSYSVMFYFQVEYWEKFIYERSLVPPQYAQFLKENEAVGGKDALVI